jgi:hypothetical protein
MEGFTACPNSRIGQAALLARNRGTPNRNQHHAAIGT